MKKKYEFRTIDEIFHVYNGSTPSKSNPSFWNSDDVNWFTIEDIRLQGRVINKTKQFISQEGFASCSLKLLPKQTILICCTASVGEYAITNVELCTNQQFNGLVIKEMFDDLVLPKYIFHYCATLKKELLSLSGKTTIDFVSMKKLKSIKIPIPPLEEQQKIVEKLDKAFELIDQAKANIEQNIINAKELFQSKLDEVFSQKGDGWKEMKLKELAEIKSGFAFKSSSFLKNGKYQIIKMGNVRFGQLRLNESPAFVDEIDIKILEKTLLIKGDVIITQTGTKGKRDYGYSTIIENDNLLLNQRLSYIRPFSKAINYFILYYTWSSFFRDQFFSNENGTVGQGNVSISAIQDAIIIMPSLQCQKNIVKKINQLYNNCQDYENMNLKKLSNLEELRKSILEKAFKGELTN